MTMRQFIQTNRDAIDLAITQACPNIGRLNNQERHNWIMNDEKLYLWAKRAGVKV